MKFNLLVTLILILVKCPSFFGAFTNRWELSSSSVGHLGRITGGHDAEPHSHPYIISLQLRLLWVRMHFCAGTLLSRNWILTAGHCIKESWIIRWLPMDAVAGAHQVDKFGIKTQVVSVAQRIAHPQYNGGISTHDIGVLRTATPFEFTDEVRPAYLPKGFGVGSDPLQLSGWGVLSTTLFFPDLPENLQEVSVTYVPFKECYEAIEKKRDPGETNPLNEKSHICTGPLTGGISGCSGDSGGPLIQFVSTAKYYGETDDGSYNEEQDHEQSSVNEIVKHESPRDDLPVVIGVVSWGISPCGEKGAPTVFTNVTSYLNFINQYVKDDFEY